MIAARCGLAIVALLASGCVSIVTVEKATPKSTGVRFNLPEVFIQVVPKPDGTYELKKHFMPDPDQEYVVNTKSVFGSYTIEVKRGANNLLESVSFEPDTTAVAKQAIGTAATLRAAEIEASAARAKADAAEAKSGEDKAVAAVEAAEKTLKDAAVALEVAQGRHEVLTARNRSKPPPAGTEEQLFQAELALSEARIRHEAAKTNHTAVRNRYKVPPVGQAAIPPGLLQLYRVDMKDGTSVLREVSTRPKP